MSFAGLTAQDFFDSWAAKEGVVPTQEVMEWIDCRKRTVEVDIRKISFDKCEGWFLADEEGAIRNDAGTFFKIAGLRFGDGSGGLVEQPILLQNEIGYLGFLCKKFDGILHFLVQAKIEPGNVDAVQLSPTIQATKSNFTRKHQGRAPSYLEWFLDAEPDDVVVDSLQSEQSSRFLGKRNRNIIVFTDEDVSVLPSHCWMTLGQLSKCLIIDNMVNMDTRTVLSCIPYAFAPVGQNESWPSWIDPARGVDWGVRNAIIRSINDAKMFDESHRELIDVRALESWSMGETSLACDYEYPFKVVFCDIKIEGREVRRWCQPLFEAEGRALFGLLCRMREGRAEFLVKLSPEMGSFDVLELGPTVQHEAFSLEPNNPVECFFQKCLSCGYGEIAVDTLQSEEGGRFYHEENRNVIIWVSEDDDRVPEEDGYYWCDFLTLMELCQERLLNIQLRNLLSLLGVLF